MTYSEKNYGVGDPDCKICKGVGYISYQVEEHHPDFGKIFDCECRAGQVQAQLIAHLRKVGGLEYLAEKTFDTFNPAGASLHDRQRSNLQSAFDRSLAYAENPDGWLLLAGKYGCGKTHLAAAIANAAIEKGSRVLFVTAPDLLDYLRSAYNLKGEDDDFQSRFDEVRTIPLLVIDDLGVESPTAWATETFYQILNHRYTAYLPTVITTNHNVEDLQQRLRSRLSDIDITQIVTITAPDYRQGTESGGLNDLNGISLYTHMTFDSFELRSDLTKPQQSNLKKALSTSKKYASSPQGWLIFIGDYGCGKTHLAAAIANEYRQQGNDVLFITVPDLLDHLRATFSPESRVSYDRRFSEIKTSPLLILDDLGMESATPWAREKLYQLINYRYNAQLPTIITTSQALDSLDPRLVTRMRDKRICQIFAILASAYLGTPG